MDCKEIVELANRRLFDIQILINTKQKIPFVDILIEKGEFASRRHIAIKDILSDDPYKVTDDFKYNIDAIVRELNRNIMGKELLDRDKEMARRSKLIELQLISNLSLVKNNV